MTSLVTATLAVFCSVVARKTSTSLLASYVLIGGLFLVPVAARYFFETFFPGQPVTEWVERLSFVSPLAAAWSVPLQVWPEGNLQVGELPISRVHWHFIAFYTVALVALTGLMGWLFNRGGGWPSSA